MSHQFPSDAPTPQLAALFPTYVPDPEKLVYDYVLAAAASVQPDGKPALSFYADRARSTSEGRTIEVVRGWPAYPGKVPAIGVAIGPDNEDQQQQMNAGGFAGDVFAHDEQGNVIGTASYYAEPMYSTVIVELIHENRDERDRLHDELRRVLFPIRRWLTSQDPLIKRVSLDSQKTEEQAGPPTDEEPMWVYISIFSVGVHSEMLEAQEVTGPDGVVTRIDAATSTNGEFVNPDPAVLPALAGPYNPALPAGGVRPLTIDERKAYVLGLLPENRGVDPALGGLFGPSDLSTYGAPRSGKVLWPDGGHGKFTALTIVGGGGPNPSTADEYKVTHRHHVDTSGTDRATWIPRSPSFTPLTDYAAAALVTRTPEHKTENVARNAYVPSDAQLAAFNAQLVAQEDPSSNPYFHLVTGRCPLSAPTTDELIQWASHKWGIPTDQFRAQMHLESKWSMDMKGDRATMPTQALYDANPSLAKIPGGLDVYQSLGISQVKWDPRPELDLGPGAEPLRWLSTAFNLDYCAAMIRFHLDDPGGHRTNWGDGSYVAGDYANAQGGWYQPYPWGNAGQLNYVAQIAARMADKPWLLADFSNVLGQVKIFHQPLMTRNVNGFVTDRPEILVEDFFPPTAPTAAPQNPHATPGDTTITVTWDPVTLDGGSPIVGYLLQEVNEGWIVDHPFTDPTFTFTGLTNGHAQTFVVRAYNAVGEGPNSAPVTATPTAATVPGAPTGLSGTPSSHQVALTWTAPASNGGSPITGYRVTPIIGGVDQTPIDTGSTSTSFTVTGLTNGTAYSFKVRALNAVGAGANSSTAGPYTPNGPAVPAQIPIISRGKPVAASNEDFTPASRAVDSDRTTQWRSVYLPSTGAPQWVAVNLNSVAGVDKTSVWCCIENQCQPRYQPSSTLGQNGPAGQFTLLMRNYKLQAHPSSSSTCPADNDAGWVDLATITDNRRGSRIHTGLDLHTYGWFKIRVTDSSGFAGNDDVAFEFELRNVAGGADDSLLVYGDSICMEAFGIVNPNTGNAWAGGAEIAAAIATASGRVPPVITDYSTGGWTTAIADPVKADYLGGMPHKMWAIGFGHNDAHAAGLDLNTDSPAGVNSTYAQAVKTRLQSLHDYAVSQGATRVIFPSIPYTTNGTFDEANVLILNTIIGQVIAANPSTAVAGPDFHAYFAAHPTTLRDGIHPGGNPPADGSAADGGKSGYEHYHQLWADWLLANVYT